MHTVIIHVDEQQRSVDSHALIFGAQNPEGPRLTANSQCFLRDGKPWFPIMGEMHYSRYPKVYWKEALLKMHAGGIDIIASYVFWIHHEEIEGKLEWDSNRDLRCFVELCAKHGYSLFLRVGPWCHGECRNGGFPDWLLKKNYEPRTNNERYFARVRQWYAAIYQQVSGLLYKDGGPIIGIQIENEYGHCGGLRGEDGKRHMLTLKRIAQEIGFDVPFYTATGWGGAVVVDDELLPVMGGYASLPWTQHTNPLPPSVHYLFSKTRDDFLIGADLATQDAMLTYSPEKYPFALAELGPGNQCTYHRRPLLSAQDVEAVVLVKLGSGANLIGYYMYHGGSNPTGKLSTMQESKATGYLNDLPVISYDFQAPIREYGQISDKYRALKVLHLFLHDFGEQFAQTSVTLPPENPIDPGDTDTLRYAVRDQNGSGFLFVNNHQRRMDMTEKSACRISIQSGQKTVEFPEFSLSNGRFAILPYNFPLGYITLHCATVQPLCRISSEGADYIVFFAYPDISAKYLFDKQHVQSIRAHGAEITEEPEHFMARVDQASMESIITLQSKAGNTVHCVTLTREQADNAWKADVWGRERLIVSSAEVTWSADGLDLCSTGHETISFSLFPDAKHGLTVNGTPLTGKQDGIFTTYTLSVPHQEIPVSIKALPNAENGVRQWELTIPMDAMPELNDIFLHIDFEGDVGQLFLDDRLVADWFYDGRIWEIGLKRFTDRLRGQPFCLHISPLTTVHAVYLETRPHYDEHGVALTLNTVTAVPQYRVSM
jgi:beta-galactosidase